MGVRFRRSIKIAPGIRLNFNKNSMGLSFGVKGAHVTVNSKGRKTASVGIPGTGLSYTTSTSKSRARSGNSRTTGGQERPAGGAIYASPKKPRHPAYAHYKRSLVTGVILMLIALVIFMEPGGSMPLSGILAIIGFILIVRGLLYRPAGRIYWRNYRAPADQPPASPDSQPENDEPGFPYPNQYEGTPEWEINPQEDPETLAGKVTGWATMVKESAAVADGATSPDVFFRRYDLIVIALDRMVRAEEILGCDAAAAQEDLNYMKRTREEHTDLFIRRAYENMLDGLAELKTERGRENRRNAFFASFERYTAYLTPANQERLNSLK